MKILKASFIEHFLDLGIYIRISFKDPINPIWYTWWPVFYWWGNWGPKKLGIKSRPMWHQSRKRKKSHHTATCRRRWFPPSSKETFSSSGAWSKMKDHLHRTILFHFQAFCSYILFLLFVIIFFRIFYWGEIHVT